MLFESTATEAGAFVSLKEYVARMPEGQKEIYYITGMSRETLEQSPHLEAFRAKGFEVLFMTDPVDEWVVQALTEYDEKPLKAVDRGDISLDSEEEKKEKEKKREEAQKEFSDLISLIADRLKDKVKEVRFSNRLTDSACCLVAEEYGMNANMERIMKAMNQAVPESKRVLELNPDHPDPEGHGRHPPAGPCGPGPGRLRRPALRPGSVDRRIADQGPAALYPAGERTDGQGRR